MAHSPPSSTVPGWLRIELTHVELSQAALAQLSFLLLDELWTRTDLGETGFASLFVAARATDSTAAGNNAGPNKHFRVRLALAATGYVATVTEERAFYRPKTDSTAARVCVDLLQQVFDARELPEVGVGDELSLHLRPSPQLLLSVDEAPLGTCDVTVLDDNLGVRLALPKDFSAAR